MSELQIQLPETELLLDLVRKAESCQSQCKEILKAPFSLKVNIIIILLFSLECSVKLGSLNFRSVY